MVADLSREQSLQSSRPARGQGSESKAESRAWSGPRTHVRGVEGGAKPSQGAEEKQVLEADQMGPQLLGDCCSSPAPPSDS